MSYLFGDMALGSTSRGRISHKGAGEEWEFREEWIFREEDDGGEDNGEGDDG